MNDRLTRKQLREDPLMEGTATAADFAAHHIRLVLGVAAVAAVLVVGVVLFRSASARGADEAAGMLAEARGAVNQGTPEGAVGKLTELVEKHGKSPAGKQALMLFADVRYEQGQYAEAETFYRQALAKFQGDPVLSTVARRGLAATLENLNRPSEAAEIYDELTATTTNPVVLSGLRMDIARCLILAGQGEQAKPILEELKNAPDNPQLAREAEMRLAELAIAG